MSRLAHTARRLGALDDMHLDRRRLAHTQRLVRTEVRLLDPAIHYCDLAVEGGCDPEDDHALDLRPHGVKSMAPSVLSGSRPSLNAKRRYLATTEEPRLRPATRLRLSQIPERQSGDHDQLWTVERMFRTTKSLLETRPGVAAFRGIGTAPRLTRTPMRSIDVPPFDRDRAQFAAIARQEDFMRTGFL
jgi:hypothetical protein